jgi:hypothetical protein
MFSGSGRHCDCARGTQLSGHHRIERFPAPVHPVFVTQLAAYYLQRHGSKQKQDVVDDFALRFAVET